MSIHRFTFTTVRFLLTNKGHFWLWTKTKSRRAYWKMQIHYLFIHSLFTRNIAISPVTTVVKAAQHLILKLAELICHKLNHSLLKYKIYLNLHSFFPTVAPVCHLSFFRDSGKAASLFLLSYFYQWSFSSHGTHHCCRLPSWGDKFKFVCVDCVRRICFIQDLATGQLWNLLTWLFI